MQSIEMEAVSEIATRTGVAVDDVIRLAVCQLVDSLYDVEVRNIRPEVIPELEVELEIVKAGRHGVTQMLAQRGDDLLRERLIRATSIRESYERAMEHAKKLGYRAA